ncbi:MAG: excinuclease ABC subunit UvrA [Candidatus Kapabacteria bacterium]|nr:excinuclease ABC subunit UvrA [Candidatus Kapabacteria bacterium]
MNKSDIKPAEKKFIRIRGAKLHNLKNIDLDIPRNAFTVITGLSGSGKSSLAFDTIYAEGQRRFVESLSSYARQFLERMGKPDVESIIGLPPAVAIEQKPPSKNPRSTVGTSTEIYDYLRILFARIGKTLCKNCGKEIHKDSPASVVQSLLTMNEGDKFYLLFPLHPQAKTVQSELENIRSHGFFRVILAGSDEIINLENAKLPKKTLLSDVYVLADRFVLKKDNESITRITDSLETAFIHGPGKVILKNTTKNTEFSYSSNFACAECDIIYAEPEPRLFSFNNPYGACPTCQGFGRTIGIDEDLVFPDRYKSISKGAIAPFKSFGFTNHLRDLLKIAPKYGIPVDSPVLELTSEHKRIIMEGVQGYIGVNGFFNLLEENNTKIQNRMMVAKYRGYTRCNACDGSRLRTSARQVFINGMNIPALIKLSIENALGFFKKIELSNTEKAISDQVLREITYRLELLLDIGLGYLTLDRLSHSLSGGEAQRINLSTALGFSLVGTLYVLDEPSIGLHPRDTQRLLNILYKLRNLGNTIIVVEHDPEIMRQADFIVDMGPRAGSQGGNINYSGKIEGILSCETSLTGKYLSGAMQIPIPKTRCKGTGDSLKIIKPRKNNLMIDSVEIPLGCMTVVTGVSGSGKSTLVHDVIYNYLKKFGSGYTGQSAVFEKFLGSEAINNVELVDQSPIGRSSRSTPVTYTKAFDYIRDIFAQTQAAKQLGWRAGHFSFNVEGGRCEICEGEGIVTVEMQFLPDVHLICEACNGTRYKKDARTITYKDKSIIDVLNMTIDEAAEYFCDYERVKKKLKILQDVGLGYLQLGQPSSMLSGGESQRVKLANHLDSQRDGSTMFIFDEPTTGLHTDDIAKLLYCFSRLVDQEHTVLIIEHNLHVIASADWVIDLGPDAGEKGGRIVAFGTPETIAKKTETHTGRALSEFFNIMQ